MTVVEIYINVFFPGQTREFTVPYYKLTLSKLLVWITETDV